MNRRAALIAAITAGSTRRVVAEDSAQSKVLRQLIDEVIIAGNFSNLEELVAEDITIPTLGVSDREAFLEASEEGYQSRVENYTELMMEVVSIAEHEEWAHALVLMEGELATGRMQRLYVFYVAKFEGGRVSDLYLG